MKFHLISDNIDTIVGMRLAGITGVLVHEDEEVKKALTDDGREFTETVLDSDPNDGKAGKALSRPCLRPEAEPAASLDCGNP